MIVRSTEYRSNCYQALLNKSMRRCGLLDPARPAGATARVLALRMRVDTPQGSVEDAISFTRNDPCCIEALQKDQI
jgi:hypothetical protein